MTQASVTRIAGRKLFSRDVFDDARPQSITVCPAVAKGLLCVDIVTLRLLHVIYFTQKRLSV